VRIQMQISIGVRRGSDKAGGWCRPLGALALFSFVPKAFLAGQMLRWSMVSMSGFSPLTMSGSSPLTWPCASTYISRNLWRTCHIVCTHGDRGAAGRHACILHLHHHAPTSLLCMFHVHVADRCCSCGVSRAMCMCAWTTWGDGWFFLLCCVGALV